MSDVVRLSAVLADRYRLDREIGAGGMATVYLAHDLKHDRDVAVKVLKPELGAVLGAERFLSEIKVTANLQHPNLLPLFDSGDADGLLYYVMPYIEGETLRQRLQRERQLPLDETTRLATLIAGGLHFAHIRGVVHRDLKPENILLQAGQPIVADFGIALAVSNAGGARITQTGLSLGTPSYMSPEQAAGDHAVDARTDQYALAALTYEMLTGEPPHTGPTVQMIIARLMTETPRRITSVRPGVPLAVDAAVQRALSKSPADRFASCGDFARALEKQPADRPQSAEEPLGVLNTSISSGDGTLPALARGFHRSVARRRIAFAVVAMLLVAAAGWAFVSSTSRGEIEGPRSVAVLPFENVGGDSTQEYFSAGMTDDIASALVNAGVRVAPRASALAFRGKRPTAKEVGSALAVDAVLTGSVSRLGDRLRVAVELADARAGVVLSSFSQNRETRDLFAVQRAITDSIVGVLRVRLQREQSRATRINDEDPVAHDLVMQGRFLADLGTREAVTKAVALFNRALEKAPQTVSAYVGLAYAYNIVCDGFVPPIDAYPKAKVALGRAMRVDSTRAEVWSISAQITAYEWDWPRMRREMERARALNPNDPILLFDEAVYQLMHGDRARAVSAGQGWARVDPLNVVAASMLEFTYFFNRQYDSTLAVARRIEQLQPGFAYLDAFAGYAFGRQRRFAEAESTFRAAEPVLGHRSPGLAWVLALQGKKVESLAILTEIERDWKAKYVVPEMIAWAYDALGDRGRTYEWLERGVEVHSWWAAISTGWPAFEKLRDEERYRAIRRRVNLPEVAAR